MLLTMRLREGHDSRHVMRGRVPRIHVFLAARKQDVDARNKCGHDVERGSRLSLRLILRSDAQHRVSKDAAATAALPTIFF
jgi:hypothetical protein